MDTAIIIEGVAYLFFPGTSLCQGSRSPFISRKISNVVRYYIFIYPYYRVPFVHVQLAGVERHALYDYGIHCLWGHGLVNVSYNC